MILLHFWKLLKFPDVIPSFCSLGDLQASLGQLCFSSVSFSCVIWCTLLHPITSYVIVNLRALAKHQDSVLHSLPWVHQLWHEARSHLLQTVLGSLQLICSCWEERLEGFQFKNNLRPRMERNNWNKQGLFRQNGRFQLVQKVHSPCLTQSKLCQLHLTELTPDPSWISGFFIFQRLFLQFKRPPPINTQSNYT